MGSSFYLKPICAVRIARPPFYSSRVRLKVIFQQHSLPMTKTIHHFFQKRMFKAVRKYPTYTACTINRISNIRCGFELVIKKAAGGWYDSLNGFLDPNLVLSIKHCIYQERVYMIEINTLRANFCSTN